jgi:hypothetical protein
MAHNDVFIKIEFFKLKVVRKRLDSRSSAFFNAKGLCPDILKVHRPVAPGRVDIQTGLILPVVFPVNLAVRVSDFQSGIYPYKTKTSNSENVG